MHSEQSRDIQNNFSERIKFLSNTFHQEFNKYISLCDQYGVKQEYDYSSYNSIKSKIAKISGSLQHDKAFSLSVEDFQVLETEINKFLEDIKRRAFLISPIEKKALM